jgi:hypothetical protein
MFTLFRYKFDEQSRRTPTPKFCTAGAGGVTSVDTCVGAAA